MSSPAMSDMNAELATRTDDRFAALITMLDNRFAKIDARFDKIDARFDKMEAKFDAKFDMVTEKLTALDIKVAHLTGQFSLMKWVIGVITAFIGAVVAKTFFPHLGA
jgi:hypothetical protein